MGNEPWGSCDEPETLRNHEVKGKGGRRERGGERERESFPIYRHPVMEGDTFIHKHQHPRGR